MLLTVNLGQSRMKAHSVRTGIPIHGTATRRLPCLALAIGLVLRKGDMQWLVPRRALHRAIALQVSTGCTFDIRADAAGPDKGLAALAGFGHKISL